MNKSQPAKKMEIVETKMFQNNVFMVNGRIRRNVMLHVVMVSKIKYADQVVPVAINGSKVNRLPAWLVNYAEIKVRLASISLKQLLKNLILFL